MNEAADARSTMPRPMLLSLGSLALDQFVVVHGPPKLDGKDQAIRSFRCVGGLAGNAAVAAARLGLPSAYFGPLDTRADDQDCRLVRELLLREGVMAHWMERPAARPARAWILTSQSSDHRWLIHDLEGVPLLREDDEESPPPPDWLLEDSAAVLVDNLNPAWTLAAMAECRRLGLPVIATIEGTPEIWPMRQQVNAIAERCDHLLVDRGSARHLTGSADDVETRVLAEVLSRWNHATAVVTDGERGCWLAESSSSSVLFQAAFPIQAIDTTGCGDIFRAAYAWSVIEAMPPARRLRLAAAAAALQATRMGSSIAAPTRIELERFLADHPDDPS